MQYNFYKKNKYKIREKKMKNMFSSNSTTRWVKVRFRRVKNRDYYLDAHDYGRKYWCFPVRTRKN